MQNIKSISRHYMMTIKNKSLKNKLKSRKGLHADPAIPMRILRRPLKERKQLLIRVAKINLPYACEIYERGEADINIEEALIEKAKGTLSIEGREPNMLTISNSLRALLLFNRNDVIKECLSSQHSLSKNPHQLLLAVGSIAQHLSKREFMNLLHTITEIDKEEKIKILIPELISSIGIKPLFNFNSDDRVQAWKVYEKFQRILVTENKNTENIILHRYQLCNFLLTFRFSEDKFSGLIQGLNDFDPTKDCIRLIKILDAQGFKYFYDFAKHLKNIEQISLKNADEFLFLLSKNKQEDQIEILSDFAMKNPNNFNLNSMPLDFSLDDERRKKMEFEAIQDKLPIKGIVKERINTDFIVEIDGHDYTLKKKYVPPLLESDIKTQTDFFFEPGKESENPVLSLKPIVDSLAREKSISLLFNRDYEFVVDKINAQTILIKNEEFDKEGITQNRLFVDTRFLDFAHLDKIKALKPGDSVRVKLLYKRIYKKSYIHEFCLSEYFDSINSDKSFISNITKKGWKTTCDTSDNYSYYTHLYSESDGISFEKKTYNIHYTYSDAKKMLQFFYFNKREIKGKVICRSGPGFKVAFFNRDNVEAPFRLSNYKKTKKDIPFIGWLPNKELNNSFNDKSSEEQEKEYLGKEIDVYIDILDIPEREKNRRITPSQIVLREKSDMQFNVLQVLDLILLSLTSTRIFSNLKSYCNLPIDHTIQNFRKYNISLFLEPQKQDNLIYKIIKNSRENLYHIAFKDLVKYDKLKEGQVIEGAVKNITDYGVFIDLGGIDGLIHITDLSWGRISHPEDIVSLHEIINVVILKIDKEKRKIQLGLKQLSSHPWEALDEKISVGDTINGKVVVVADYGVFVELQTGVEALLHVSEMSWSTHLRSASDFYKVGDSVEAKILTLDREERKMSLGLKQMLPDPWKDIEKKFPVDSKHKVRVRNFTNFGIFVELDEGIDGLVHISDLSWTKKIKHPAEFTKIDSMLDVVILDIDQENRKISVGHKQTRENPWDAYEKKFKVDQQYTGTVKEMYDKGALVDMGDSIEAFCSKRNLEKEDGNKAKVGESLDFKIIEFSKENKRILVSHISTHKQNVVDEKEIDTKKVKADKKIKAPKVQKTTLGDLDDLSVLKEDLKDK